MISVILVVYNLEPFIERSIQSVLAQTQRELELIIIDDGSVDRTTEICLKYQKQDKRIIYIKKKNEGQGIARTLGVRIAKGEFVTFLDGDDWLEVDALEKMHQAAISAQADIVVGDIWYVYQRADEIEKKYSKIRYQNLQIITKDECFDKISKLRTFTWGKLYKKEFLLKEKFKQSSFAYEDTATVPLLMLHAENIVYINTPVYNYLKNRTGSTIYKKEKAIDLLTVLKELKAKFMLEENYVLLHKDIMRLFWGQIRSLLIIHHVNWDEACDKKNIYNQLILFMRENFSSFIFLDDEEIWVYNSELAKRALGSILVDTKKVKCFVDKNDITSRIILKGEEKEYKLPERYNAKGFDENDIWDCADELFNLLME